jgi:hypothetical protein
VSLAWKSPPARLRLHESRPRSWIAHAVARFKPRMLPVSPAHSSRRAATPRRMHFASALCRPVSMAKLATPAQSLAAPCVGHAGRNATMQGSRP